MYTKDGNSYFIVDGHVHIWDGRETNLRNIHGKQFIDCFYDYHRNLSPEEVVWDYDTYTYYGGERLMRDLFADGYVDHAIFQADPAERLLHQRVRADRGSVRAGATPSRQADLQPRLRPAQRRGGPGPAAQRRRADEPAGRQALHRRVARRLARLQARRPLVAAVPRRVHRAGYQATSMCTRGPTIRPLDRDAFDVADVDKVATDYLELNFIVEHVGLPRLEDFCWIATQESNVYGGLAVAIPFIHTRPRYFAQIIGELLYWIGEDKILFASDYALWTPKWLIEKFVDFQIPEDMLGSTPRSPSIRSERSSVSTPLRSTTSMCPRSCGSPHPGRTPSRSRPAPRRRCRYDRRRASSLESEILAALDTVTDPELDQPITELGFVRSVSSTTAVSPSICGCRRRSVHPTSPT